MDHIAMIERAVGATLRHRAFWVLGTLWALVGGCGASTSFVPQFQYTMEPEGPLPEPLARLQATIEAAEPATIVSAVIAAACLALALAVLCAVAKYVLQAGVLRSVDDLLRSGTPPGVRRGWRHGWNRRTWRLFFQNLAVDIPLAILIVGSLVVVAAPLFLLVAGSDLLNAAGILGTIALFVVWLIAVIAVSAAVSALKELWWRSAVVDDQEFLSAIGCGWRIARTNAGSVLITWVLVTLAGVVWAVVMFIALLALALVTAGVAGGPAYLLWQAGHEAAALVYGGAAASITFVLPTLVLGGLFLVFRALVWGQVYRAIADRQA